MLATGGGAILDPDNRRILKQSGVVIFLQTSIQQQLQRVGSGRGRPLLKDEGDGLQVRLEQLRVVREPLYRETADITVSTDNRRVPKVADLVLKELGLTLPEAARPVANYVPAVRVGNLVFLSGHGECGEQLKGKAGGGVSVEDAYNSARRVGLCLLSSLKHEIGDLRKVRRVVKLLGMVNAVPNFNDSPKVINGCSDLFVEVFGDAGRHARSAVGNVMLPNQISVEIEGIVAVKA